jgi:DNA-binding beta-propeller fold protein YncE
VKRLQIAIVALALSLALGAQAAPALAAPGANPLFILQPKPNPKPAPPDFKQIPPPVGEFDGPCGLAVDSQAHFYVSDYYHRVIDVYANGLLGPEYSTQLAKEDPLDGPCGLAIDPTGDLYVNNYHRNVVRFGDLSGFDAGTVIAGAGVDASHPTGVAVDAAGTVYVNERDRIASFDSAGVEGEAVGEGNLGDGYGVAVSAYPATKGFLYVPDAATDTVKVYDPATSTTDPVAEIDGSGTPLGHFLSLRDAAVAVDDFRGTVYVTDDLTPDYTEGHEAVVYAFDAAGAYLGRLKYAVQTAQPAGLAVDNSALFTQGRVYVTSGYAELGAVYAYGPESAGSAAVALPRAVAIAPSSTAAAAPAPEEPAAPVGAATVAAPAPAAEVPPAAPAPVASPAPRAKAKKHHRRHRHHRQARRNR